MLKNNKINAVIAFVAAVVLWLYVVGQVDPTTTGRITGVPVVFAGEEVLAENELALVDPGNVTVDLTIKGDRSDVRKLVANSDRISVVADVSGLTKGTHEVTLDITVPNAVELQKASIDEITVEIDDLVTKDIAVEVSYDGAFEVSQEAGNVKIDPESIAVTGAASTVQSIDHLSATVGVDELTEKTTVLTKSVTPVDANGNPVNHVKLETNEVRVTASIIASKTLPLKVETTGTPAAGFEIGEINAPATVTVSGAPSVLADLTEVKATADVTDLEADATVTLVPDLPSGITVTDPETLEAEISIAGVSSKTWSYAETEIVIDDLPEGYEATIPTQTVKVTVSAEKDTLDNIKKSDLVLHVSAAGLAEGEQEAALTQVSSLDEGSVQIDPQTIRIVLTAITTEE
jgi:YbbR domain-containing protein